MKLRDARIGWSSYSPDFSRPGDRRRFAAYADERHLPYERASLDRPYDLVLITHHSDLPAWIARKRREGDRLKLVFELIDAYLADTLIMRRVLKGIGRYALGTDSRISLDFLNRLSQTCRHVDAVICSTIEQKEAIGRYNRNVHLSFDWFGDELGEPKRDFSRSGKLRLVWEGQSITSGHLNVAADALNELSDEVELHLVTDANVHRYFGRFGSYATMDGLKALRCDKVLHPWSRESFAEQVKSADVAIIPIDTAAAFAMGKPDNKLVMLWKLGMPVLATATPAYQRAMSGAGLDMLCRTPAEWRQKLRDMLNASPTQMEETAGRGQDYAEKTYTKKAFIARFDEVFASIGFGV
jgi:hypothetical protein